LTDKTAIITGGSRGIRRNTAINLSRRGADIIFTYHSNRREAESLIAEIEAIGRKAAAFRSTSVIRIHSTDSWPMCARC
jgi:NAD(P)-dependent dehydrogenase (short-subunit alcohol dehydrogenase family)